MKISILCLTFLFLCLTLSAQRRKEFQIRIGYGLGFTQSKIESSISNGPFAGSSSYEERSNMQTIPIELRYELNDRINLGLGYARNKRVYFDEDQMRGKADAGSNFWIAAEYNIFNKEKYRVYTGLNLSFHNLITYSGPSIGFFVPIEMASYWRGMGARINLGGIVFINDSRFGLLLNMSVGVQRLNLYDWKYAGTKLNTDGSETIKYSTIAEAFAGVVFRIRGKK